MKENPLGGVLAIGLVAMALGTSALLIWYVRKAGKLPALQGELMVANRNQAALQGLLNEAVEYGRHDPSIEPILQSMGIRARANAATGPVKSPTRQP